MDTIDKLLDLLEYFININTGITQQETEYLLERLEEVKKVNDYIDNMINRKDD